VDSASSVVVVVVEALVVALVAAMTRTWTLWPV